MINIVPCYNGRVLPYKKRAVIYKKFKDTDINIIKTPGDWAGLHKTLAIARFFQTKGKRVTVEFDDTTMLSEIELFAAAGFNMTFIWHGFSLQGFLGSFDNVGFAIYFLNKYPDITVTIRYEIQRQKEILPSPTEVQTCLTSLIALSKQNPRLKLSLSYPGPWYIPTLKELRKTTDKFLKKMDKEKIVTVCECGHKTIYPDSSVYVCEHAPIDTEDNRYKLGVLTEKCRRYPMRCTLCYLKEGGE